MKNPTRMLYRLPALTVLLFAANVPASAVQLLVHPAATVDSLTSEEIKNLLVGKTAYWPDGTPVTLFITRGKVDEGIESLTGMNPGQFKTHWQRLTFSGRGKPPRDSEDAAQVTSMAQSERGALVLLPDDAPIGNLRRIESGS